MKSISRRSPGRRVVGTGATVSATAMVDAR
jgi:hypothetical protein